MGVKPCDSCCECDGSCCAVFFFPSTPREIDQRIERDGGYNSNDGRMAVPLMRPEALDRAERFGVGPRVRQQIEDHQDAKLYTCRHWNEDTRRCLVYDHRPDLCAKYPYGKECVGCGGVSGEEMPTGGLLAMLGCD